jgi:hypothetical protein
MRFFNLLNNQRQLRLSKPLLFYLKNNAWLCIATIMFYSLLRRSKRTPIGLGQTIAGIYTILYGFSNYWSFQYFAWSIPFWFFAGTVFSIPALVLASTYIYGLYWLLCGNPALLGPWDFIGHPYWPDFLKHIRNLTVLFFLASACVFLFCGIKAQLSELLSWIRGRQIRCDTNS